MKKLDLNLTRKAVKSGPKRPQRSDPVPDPLADVDYSAGIEDSSQQEASAMLSGFRDRAKRENERFTLATDSEFWIALGFQSREQKEAFLQAMEWFQYGDKYLDGCQIAEDSGIALPKVDLPDPTKRSVDKRLAALAMKPKAR